MSLSSLPISHSCNQLVVALRRTAELWRGAAFSSTCGALSLSDHKLLMATGELPSSRSGCLAQALKWLILPLLPALSIPTWCIICASNAASLASFLNWLCTLVAKSDVFGAWEKTAKISGRERESWLQICALSSLEQGLKSQSVKWACGLLEAFFHPAFPIVLAPAACRGLAHWVERRL